MSTFLRARLDTSRKQTSSLDKCFCVSPPSWIAVRHWPTCLCGASFVGEEGVCLVWKRSSRPGSWRVTLFAALRTVCVSTVWSPSRGCVVADRSVARFCGLRNFLHDLSSHVSGTGALVATSDVSCVKLLRELKSWRHILLVSHGVLLVAWRVVCCCEEVCQLWEALERADLSVTAWCLTLAWQVERRCQETLSAV